MDDERQRQRRLAAASAVLIGLLVVLTGVALEFSGRDGLGGTTIGPGFVLMGAGRWWFRRDDRRKVAVEARSVSVDAP